ncbi:prephenate dehydratase domain-containing protein [Mesorhizobium sp. M0145]|uniref:prephenate dehydratase domain-containing protein n=1 Tax=Mesorhizobium sp. M0145 TaxID=2956895 RepID=UPI0033375711
MNHPFRRPPVVDISAISQVGYVGPAGTWTHQATLDIFGDSVKLVPLEADLFAAYETGEVEALCVPVATSLDVMFRGGERWPALSCD